MIVWIERVKPYNFAANNSNNYTIMARLFTILFLLLGTSILPVYTAADEPKGEKQDL